MYSRYYYYFVKWKEKKEIFLYYSFKREGGLIIYTRYYYFIKWKEKKEIFKPKLGGKLENMVL